MRIGIVGVSGYGGLRWWWDGACRERRPEHAEFSIRVRQGSDDAALRLASVLAEGLAAN